MQQLTKKLITGPNVSCKKSDHRVEAHQIVSRSSARSSVPRPRNSDKNTHLLPRLGGGRILKTNKQRIDLLRRIAEVLITSDPWPLLSESASRSSPSPSSILTHSFSHMLFFIIFQAAPATPCYSEPVSIIGQHQQSARNNITIMWRGEKSWITKLKHKDDESQDKILDFWLCGNQIFVT